MSDLWNEIEDDIRQERFDQLWKRYGKVAVVAALLIIVVTIVIVASEHRQRTQAMAETAKFTAGINEANAGHFKAAIIAFSKLTGDPSSSYYGPAMLRKAGAETAAGDKAAATKTYRELASRRSGEFSALAALLAPPDTANMPVSDRDSAFYFTESEQKGWQLLKAGKTAEAVHIFLSLRDDPDAPFTERQRLQQALQYLAPDKAVMHD